MVKQIKPQQKKFGVKRDDNVEVLAGKDKGKRGTVVRVIRKSDKVVVSGVNIVKKAVKRQNEQEQGGIVEVESPIHISNVGIVCKKCGKPVRIGYKIDGGKRSRVCRKCGEVL